MLGWESDVVTDDVSVRRGKWCLRQSESVDDLVHLNCLKQVRHGTKSLSKVEGFFFIVNVFVFFFPSLMLH